MIDTGFLETLLAEAGKAILEIHDNSNLETEEDSSTVTLAGERAHQIILEGLQSHFPDISVLSKMGPEVDYSTRREWSRFWLVDPLDGTQGFIKRNNEFIMNIALIEEKTPVLGLIFLPVGGILYLALKGQGCWKIDKEGRNPLASGAPRDTEPIRVVISRFGASSDVMPLIDLLPDRTVTVRRDSAFKFCAIAEGSVDFYPELNGTAEWYTAAGHAIVAEAGGVVMNGDGEPLAYNKPNLQNGPFVAAPSLAWLKEMDMVYFQKKLADWKFEDVPKSCR